MNQKKNAISYVAWMLILLFTGASFAFFGMIAAHLYDFETPFMAAGFVLIFFGIVCLIYFLTGCMAKSLGHKEKLLSPQAARFAQRALFVLCIVGGLALRIYLLPMAGEEAAYYEISKVTDQSNILVQAVQGSVYFYCMLLHGLFFVAGNQWIAGIFLQIVLQAAGTGLIYFAIRRLTDRWPAFLVLVFLSFSPVSVRAGLTYSPQILYFVLFAFVFLLLADYIKRSESTEAHPVLMWFYTFLIGIGIGFVCYVDVTGAVLLVPAMGLLRIKRTENRYGLWIMRLLFMLVSAAAFFVLLIFCDSILSNTTFMGVLNAWIITYGSVAFHTRMLTGEINIELPILICLVSFGVFSFWRRKHTERFSIWVFMVCAVCLLHFSSITPDNMDGSYLLYVLLAALSAVSMTELFYRQEDRGAVMVQTMEAEEIMTEPVMEMKSTVQLIENPLPLPKKHVKKVLDYAIEPEADRMDYDIEVADTDNYDI